MPSLAHVILPDCFFSLNNSFDVTWHTYMVWKNAEGGIEFQNSIHVDVIAQTPSNSLHSSHSASWWRMCTQPSTWCETHSNPHAFDSYFAVSREYACLHLTCNHAFISWLLTSSPVTAGFHRCSGAYKCEFEFHLSRAASEVPGLHILAAGCSCVATILQLSSRCVCLWEVLPLTLSLNADRISSVRA